MMISTVASAFEKIAKLKRYCRRKQVAKLPMLKACNTI